MRPRGPISRSADALARRTTPHSPTPPPPTLEIAVRWPPSPRILSEQLAPLSDPLACLLTPGEGGALGPPGVVAALAAGALLDLKPVAAQPGDAAAWLAPHQVPAVARLRAILARYRGALLADAVGLGKSYVALAVALGTGEPFALVVPAVLVPQWRSLLARHDSRAPVLTHESLSGRSIRLTAHPTIRLLVVDEAHRFRNPETNRYRALARLAAGGQGGQGGQGGEGGRGGRLGRATP